MLSVIDRDRVLQYGTREFIRAPLTADVDLTDDMPVAFTFDRTVFYDAAWTGPSTIVDVDDDGTERWVRRAELFIGDAVVLDKGEHVVWARITDTTEAPLIRLGRVRVE